MAEPARVKNVTQVPVLALCGDSMLLEGIKASLQGHDGVETVLIDTSRPSAVQVLDRLSPDIILFDLTPGRLGWVLTFLRTHTDVLLIGLDIEYGLALFLSEEWRMLPTVADLMQVIEARLQAKTRRPL